MSEKAPQSILKEVNGSIDRILDDPSSKDEGGYDSALGGVNGISHMKINNGIVERKHSRDDFDIVRKITATELTEDGFGDTHEAFTRTYNHDGGIVDPRGRTSSEGTEYRNLFAGAQVSRETDSGERYVHSFKHDNVPRAQALIASLATNRAVKALDENGKKIKKGRRVY